MPDRPHPRQDESGESAILLTHRRLLGPRLHLHNWIRAILALTLPAAALFGRYGLGLEGIDVEAITVLAVFIGLYNAGAWALSRRYRDPTRAGADYPRLLRITYGAIILDFLALTLAIWLVGGCRSPFVAVYLLHVIVSSMLLSRVAALSLTCLAYALLALLVVGEWTVIAPPHLPSVAGTGPLSGVQALEVLVVYALVFGLTSFLLLGVTRELRRGERRIRMANAELSRLSEQRRDFLHIAVHNLKAPVGAVTMFLGNIREGLAGPVTKKQDEWLERSLTRLGDLTGFMTNMESLATLDTDIIEAEFTRVDLPALLTRIVDEYRDVAEAHRHELTLEIEPGLPPVLGFDRLIGEALVNYMTNAIKYTPNGGRIRVHAGRRGPAVRVEVRDSGVGIDKEDRDRLFGEFVRIPNKGTEVAKVKGSGLGLSIVRRIVIAHGGTVGVESEPGRGSTFYLELPAFLE